MGREGERGDINRRERGVEGREGERKGKRDRRLEKINSEINPSSHN